jgi:glycosyltransferase involved in cell wall biosynthesis
MKPLVASHPFGNPNVYNLAGGLFERGMLGSFHTSLFAPLGSHHRWHRGLEGAPVRTHPLPEIFRLAMTHCPIRRWNGRSPRFADWVAYRFDRTVARTLTGRDSSAYCYEDSAAATFSRARELGMRTIYDLPTGYYEAKSWQRAEAERDPSLIPFLPGLDELPAKLDRKRRELQLADVVVCASAFTRGTVRPYVPSSRPVIVVPYGVDLDCAPKLWSESDLLGPVEVFFAGQLGPQKGLHYLFEALSGMPRGAVRLSLAGSWAQGFREWIVSRYSVPFVELGQVPHNRISTICRRSHLLVFPSLFDGFGLVLLEAMAAGIPVIASDRCGAPDVIADGAEGLVVPAAEPLRLRTALEWAAENRGRLAEMGCAARRTAERFTWARYRERLIAAIAPYLN